MTGRKGGRFIQLSDFTFEDRDGIDIHTCRWLPDSGREIKNALDHKNILGLEKL